MVGFGRSCHKDSKNVIFVDVGHVETVLDLIKSYGWGGLGGVDGLSKWGLTINTLKNGDNVTTFVVNNIQQHPTLQAPHGFFGD